MSDSPFQPPLAGVFPDVAASINLKGSLELPDTERQRAYAKEAARAQEIEFAVDGSRYALQVPDPDAMLGRLRTDRTFAYARVPEGFWFAVWMLDVAEAGIAADPRASALSAPQRRALALQLCAEVRRNQGAFAPAFMDETLADIPVHAARPDFLRAVSFKGFPTADEDVFLKRTMPPRDAVLRVFARHFRPGETIYDATLWKRLLIAGHLRELPALCRDRPVVLVASRFFADLQRRWQLTSFRHVQIPPRLSQLQRWDLLARLEQALAAASTPGTRPPVLLMQCGGSLAYWLITRLYARFPRVFYLDLGQALNGWFFDVEDVTVQLWMKIYARTVIANCDLEAYYRALKGSSYEAWLRALP